MNLGLEGTCGSVKTPIGDASIPSSASGPAQPSVTDGAPASDAMGSFSQGLERLREYAFLLLSCKIDRAALKLRTLLVGAFVASLLLFTLCVFVLVGSVLAFAGMAQGLGNLLGGNLWAGCLVTGALLLTGVFVSLYTGIVVTSRRYKERTVARYEQRNADLQARFGASPGALQ